ncbi:MAG: UvrD-helicase domain-containing protein, partial [Giesbergeria sp.]|nr:UvrD-helicase domain-containing protein [Giesbergeria sp.]
MSPSPQFTAKRITPTPQQLAVQTASAQTLLIEANAGAAKTTTLALRMAEGWARGIRPEDFLALTHTASAC